MRALLDSDPVELTDEDAQAVHKYEYKGGDNSILYNYVYSPFAAWIASKCPMWLA
jgi:hypothetical protein